MKFLPGLLALLFLSVPASWAFPEVDLVPDDEVASQSAPDDILVELDPVSPLECVPALLLFKGRALQAASVSITEGQYTRTVSKNCMLTAGEYFAAKELMATGEQRLALTENGTASSGELYIDPYIAQRCKSLTVPSGMTAVQSGSSMPRSIKVSGKYIFDSMGQQQRVRASRFRLAAGAVVAGKTDAGVAVLTLDDSKKFLVVDTTAVASKTGDEVVALGSSVSPACLYQVKKVSRTLVKGAAGEELVPSAGQTKPVEATIHTQERMSCQPRKKTDEDREQDVVVNPKDAVAKVAGTHLSQNDNRLD